MVLDEGVAPDRLSLAGDPDHVGLAAADHPPPVVLRADDRAVGPSVLAVVERHQVVQLDLPPGSDVPEAAATFDDAVAHLGKVPAQGLADALPAADPPAERPVEPGHPGVERLERHAVISRARASASLIRFWAKPRPRYSGRVPTQSTPFIAMVEQP